MENMGCISLGVRMALDGTFRQTSFQGCGSMGVYGK